MSQIGSLFKRKADNVFYKVMNLERKWEDMWNLYEED